MSKSKRNRPTVSLTLHKNTLDLLEVLVDSFDENKGRLVDHCVLVAAVQFMNASKPREGMKLRPEIAKIRERLQPLLFKANVGTLTEAPDAEKGAEKAPKKEPEKGRKAYRK